ncbi:AAA domain-containing protein [Lignipirellula cremea]|uniref:DNA helicase n=1 Tax=Lignipirellula cremea TaxID=2528010 RepID=A0A518DLV1_9BACT|nr:AAA domain-containing protein [Lignipirellula cremea]QDU92820.1 ATP-dependent RecD-like DNA helicase [Lignipirellula cremea]
MESEAEIRQIEERRQRSALSNAEKSGETLLDLVIVHDEPGLGGRSLVTFMKRNRSLRLPWNRLRVGAPVVLSPDGASGESQHGVVSARRGDSIEVSVDDWPEGDRFRIDLSADEVTRKRQEAALRVVEGATGRTGQLREVLLGNREPRFSRPRDLEFTANLNPSQQEAVRFALSSQDLAIIHGPPGTGKTTTVVELICQAIDRGEKVLACAPSNTGVDNLLERLMAAGRRVVRIGHPARVDERLRHFTLDFLAAEHDLMKVVYDMLHDAEELTRKANRYTRSRPAQGSKNDMRREAKRLKNDARQLEQQAVNSVLDRADVICATTAFSEDLLGDRYFDLAVIDEACQSTEPGCWIPVLRADRIVLAGDHRQLPPTVLCTEAAREGLAISMLERLVGEYGPSVTRRLEVQYRMHTEIMQFSSRQFYEDSLLAHDSVASHLLHDLSHVEPSVLTMEPVSFIDTAGADWVEELEPEGQSKRNPGEGAFVLRKVAQLIEAGLDPFEIAVIAPYAAQVRWLRERSEWDGLEIDTVDGFQGREKEAVVISCVRSNAIGEIGFLADARRMNVALTRARRKLIVVGDSATLSANAFFGKLLAYFDDIDAYGSVWEEEPDL